MNSKRRCTFCKGYFTTEEMYRSGLSGVCSTECYSGLQDKARKKRARRKEHKEAAKQTGRRLPGNLRVKVKRRDGQACRYCGTMLGRIELHHIRYRSQGGPDDERNLITLCEDHHRLMHSDKRRWQPVLLAVIHANYEEGLWVTIPEAERRFKNRLAQFPPDPDKVDRDYEPPSGPV